MIEYDKKLHLICGMLIAMALGVYIPLIGLLASILAGFAKEVYDYIDYGLFDVKDMLFTWLGGAIGSVVILILQILFL